MKRNYFIQQGKAVSNNVREIMVAKWLNGSQLFEIAEQLNINRKTVANIVDRYLQTGCVEPGVGGNQSRTARTDDFILYSEYCKSKKPSMSAREIQNQLIKNKVVLDTNVPSLASISRVLTQDLGYSYKKLRNIPKESLTDDAHRKLIDYLAVCSACDATKLHFFDESSVIKTTGNRSYGHAAIGQTPCEIQRYASNATYTVNLLHGIFGVIHVNVLHGASNGLELLNFFAEALPQEDIFGNPLLKQGDFVVMDNCGFHHARHIEPLLRDMLQLNGITLLFQPPYHPAFNTCEFCFRFLKGWLRKNTELAERHTEVAIYDAISRITPAMSRNFFRYCGYIEQ